MKYGLIVIIQEETSKQYIEDPKTNHRKEHCNYLQHQA